MGKLEMFRKALALPEVVKSVELTGILKDLYTKHLELLEKNNELSAKLKTIGDITDIKKNAKVKSGYYTMEGVKDCDGNEIKFCLNCLYEHGLQIPLTLGIIERGVKDALNGRVFSQNIYGISCRKCGTQLAMSNNKQS